MLAFESFGARIGVEAPAAWAGGNLVRHLPPGAERIAPGDLDVTFRIERDEGGSGDPAVRPGWRLRRGDELVAVCPRRAKVLDVLAHELNHGVACHARGWVFVHAGAVEADGRLLLLPGPTRSGKSTLVRALVEAGCTYYSDEYAPVDSRGRVHPYPRPLRIRRGGEDRFHEVPDPHAEAERPPRRPHRVFFLRHAPGGGWRVRPVSAGEQLLSLLRESVAARVAPALCLAHLRPVAEAAGGWAGARGGAASAVGKLLATGRETPTERQGSAPRGAGSRPAATSGAGART